MNAISKPHLVDLLRIFDKKRYITPRIRYASVRSKPELIQDISRHFRAEKTDSVVTLWPAQKLRDVPVIRYDLQVKSYSFDGKVVDVPRESREKVRFQISRVPVTLHFPVIGPCQSGPPSRRTTFVSSPGSPERDTDSLEECSERSGPCSDSGSTPRSGFGDPPSWGN